MSYLLKNKHNYRLTELQNYRPTDLRTKLLKTYVLLKKNNFYDDLFSILFRAFGLAFNKKKITMIYLLTNIQT